MKSSVQLSLLASLMAFGAFGQSSSVKILHQASYFRGQSNAVALVQVSSTGATALSVSVTPDSNFTVTAINASSNWSCNVGQLLCSRSPGGQTTFDLIQFIGTVATGAPATISNSATVVRDGVSTSSTDTAPVYAPSKVLLWGAANFGQGTNMPTGPAYTAVTQGFEHVVALTLDGTIAQWGGTNVSQTVGEPTGNGFLAVSAGYYHSIALTHDGHVVTWGRNAVGEQNGVPTTAGFVAIAAEEFGGCALTNDGHIVQWGDTNATDLPTAGGFFEIAGSNQGGIALTPLGTISEWGATNLNERTGLPPGGGFINIASSGTTGLAQRQDGTLYEWGDTTNSPTTNIPTTAVTTFGSSPFTTASWAMPANGSIVIWGDAFTSYRNGPSYSGLVQGSVTFGLNAANALLPLANPTVNGGSGQTTAVNTAFATPLSVKATDSQGNVVQGVTFTFTAPGSGASGTFSNGTTSITATTDATGVASVTFTANATGGAYSVTAVYTGLPSVSFSLTNSFPLAVTAILDGGNNPIPSNTLYSPGNAYLNVNFNQAVTNATDPGNYRVLSRNDGQNPLSTSCAAIASGDSDAGVGTVTYNSSQNIAQVFFATFPASMRFKMLVCATNRTNSANSLQATVGNTTLPADVASTSFGTTPILAASGVNQNTASGTSIAEGMALTSSTSALYLNLNSAPVASTVSGSTVKLLSGTIASPSCSSSGTAVSGVVSVSGSAIVFTPSAALFTPGSYHLIVCGTVQGGDGAYLGSSGYGVNGVDFVRNFSISQVPTGMAKSGGDGQSTVVNTAFSTALAVTITDQNNSPISGAPVTFTVVPGGGGAAGSFGSSAAVNTAANGVATASTLTANSIAGGFTVTATAGSLSQTFNLTNIGLEPVTITVPAGVSFSLNGSSYTGTQTVNLAPGSYPLSTTATQSLSTGTQAVFTGWSDSGSISHNIIVGSSALAITGSFKTQYQLTVSAGSGGTATPASGTFYDAATVVNVSATANSGFVFSSWTGPVASTSSAATTVTMNAPVSITANFASLQGVTITVPAGVSFSLNGTSYTGTQTVNLGPGSYPLSTTGTQSLSTGTQAVFTGWSDSGAISHNITVGSSPLAITGSFKTQYQLTVSAGSGGTATPASGTFYDAATVVNVSATANSGYVFSSWTGAVASTSSAATTVTMNAPVSITANFASLQGVTITVPVGVSFSLNGSSYTGTQTVNLGPGFYPLSTTATQTLSAGTQAVFTGWSDSGAISHNITVGSSPLAITGSFKTQYQLTVAAGTGGTATPTSGTFYDAATVVNVSATANSGYVFSSWTGPVASTSSASTTVTMTAPKSITANFAALQGVTITVPAGVSFNLNGSSYTGTQTVNLSPGSYPLSTTGTQSLSAGTQAVFTGWSDSGAISHNITVGSSAVAITGSFKTQYQLTVAAGTGGTAGPASGTFYDAATVVNVSATANSGYVFSSWTGPVASTSSAATTVTMNAPASITANFAAQTAPVITWANPADIQFGSALGPVQYNATTSIPGTFVYSPASGTVPQIGPSQTLTVTFTPTDTVHYVTATKSVTINVTSNNNIVPVSLGITTLLSRDPNTNEIVVQITVSNTGQTTASSVEITAVKIGTTATTTALPIVLGDIAYGHSGVTTIRIPGSAGVHGAAGALSINGLYAGTAGFGISSRIALP